MSTMSACRSFYRREIGGKEWIVVLDTNKPLPEEEEQRYKPGDAIPVESRSVKVLRRVN